MRASRIVTVALAVVAPALLLAQRSDRDAIARTLTRLRAGEQIAGLPPVDSVSPAGRVVPAGSVVRGTVVARGPVDVLGRVEGSVVSLAGDVTVRRGGVVTGDAVAVAGRVLADSGEVDGELRTMSALPLDLGAAAHVAPPTPLRRTIDAARVVAGIFTTLLLIAIGVVLFAGTNLDEVVASMQRRFARAFWVGLAGQLLILPGLLVLVVALALTVIGILLIPFAIVAYAVAIAGLVLLGFLAVARLIGSALPVGDHAGPRTRAMMTIAVGVALFFVLWMAGALLSWAPLAATVVRGAALAATWAAMTLGLGAAILSRAGSHRRVAAGTRSVEMASWMTPTPVAGVIAARRPPAAPGVTR